MGGLSKMAEEKHEIIKEAKEEVEEILSEAVIKEINEFKQTAIWEENSRRYYVEQVALKKGLKKGMKKGLEEGRKKGRKEGREEGRKEGKKEGKKEESKRIIINMLQKGMKVEEIEDLIGVPKEEIERIKEQ